MKLSFSTLGCPNWSLDQICDAGRVYGFDGVDFRGYRDILDITQLAMFTQEGPKTRIRLADAGLEVSGISSGITICIQERYEQNIEEARRSIDLAHVLGAENVRIFGGGNLETNNRAELVGIGRACIEEILALDGARDLKWLFETHDIWVRSEDCRLFLDSISQPFGVVWDVGHTPRVGGETIEETYAAIGARIGYTHFKDAIYEPGHSLAMRDGWRYVLPGSGQLPLTQAVHLLAAHGYDGWLQFEHEKRWHPNLPEPETALPAFAHWARGAIASAAAAA